MNDNHIDNGIEVEDAIRTGIQAGDDSGLLGSGGGRSDGGGTIGSGT
jgi:hypothetical protein